METTADRPERAGLRQSMAGLHSWAGLLAGWVLYFVFVTGTIGYFYVEVNRWMRPELPSGSGSPPAGRALALAEAWLREAAPRADSWEIKLPVGRPYAKEEGLVVSWQPQFTGRDRDARQTRLYDGATGRFVARPEPRETLGGYGLYRMHWQLYYVSRANGGLIVGLCSMFMLVAILSGIVVHRKIFADFFTFRPRKGQRSWLDFHNLASVTALPFILMITYSGLVFLMTGLMPAGETAVRAAHAGDGREAWRVPAPERSGQAAPLAPLAHSLAAARAYWGDSPPALVTVLLPGDANGQVILQHSGARTILRDVGERLRFGAVDMRLLEREAAARSAPRTIESALFGLHEGIFAGWTLRWLYFVASLSGCAMIASGLVLWTVKRRRRNAVGGDFGFRLVECLNVGTIAGLPVAVAALFWANRLLPVGLEHRARWEAHCMFGAWGLMLLWASVRPGGKAWTEQFALGGFAFALLPVLNAVTTDKGLVASVPAGDWAMAGFDLTALATGIVLLAMAAGAKAQAVRRGRSVARPAP